MAGTEGEPGSTTTSRVVSLTFASSFVDVDVVPPASLVLVSFARRLRRSN